MSIDYVQNVLTDDDLDAIATVIDPKIVVDMRTGKTSDKEKLAVKMIDRAISDAPAISKNITIYKSFKGASSLLNSSGITENAFLTGTVKKSDSKDITLKITIPSGTKALVLPNGAYILDRGVKLVFDASEGNLIPASFATSPSAKSENFTVMVRGLYPPNREEFYNKNHGAGGRFAPGGSQRADEVVKTPAVTNQDREKRLQEREKRLQQQHQIEKKAERRRTRSQILMVLMNAAIIIGTVASLVGIVAASIPKRSPNYRPDGRKGDLDRLNKSVKDITSKRPVIRPKTNNSDYKREKRGGYVSDNDYSKYGLPKPNRDGS